MAGHLLHRVRELRQRRVKTAFGMTSALGWRCAGLSLAAGGLGVLRVPPVSLWAVLCLVLIWVASWENFRVWWDRRVRRVSRGSKLPVRDVMSRGEIESRRVWLGRYGMPLGLALSVCGLFLLSGSVGLTWLVVLAAVLYVVAHGACYVVIARDESSYLAWSVTMGLWIAGFFLVRAGTLDMGSYLFLSLGGVALGAGVGYGGRGDHARE